MAFLNKNRERASTWATKDSDGTKGMFEWMSGGYFFRVLSTGDDPECCVGGWEHVSVSKRQGKKMRMPTWEDMAFVKNLFWGEDETVVQFHPKKSEYVNFYDVLHLWKKIGVEHELPPRILVGPS